MKTRHNSFYILGKLYDPSSTLPLRIQVDVDLRDFALRTQFESNAIVVMLDLTKVADQDALSWKDNTLYFVIICEATMRR